MSDGEPAKPAKRRDHDLVEVLSAILLGAATVASAFCAYQSSLWNGEQIRDLARSNRLNFEALAKTTAATSEQLMDAATFMNYVAATSRGDEGAAQFLRARARPEFRPALEAWVAAQNRPSPPETPFLMPQYRPKDAVLAQRLRDKALEVAQASNSSNATSDLFVLHTVLVALALFCLGISAQLRTRAVAFGMLVFGGLVLVTAVVSLVGLPRARPNRSGRARPAEVSSDGLEPRLGTSAGPHADDGT